MIFCVIIVITISTQSEKPMNDYILLLLADLLLSINFAFNKIYQWRAGASLSAGFTFSAICGGFTALAFLIYNGFNFAFTFFSAMMAVLLSLLGTSYLLIGFRIIRRKGVSLYTLFLMTGGMTIPYLFGIFFLDEPFSLMRLVGLGIIIFGVCFSGFGKEKLDKTTLLLCAAVFLLNGAVSVVSKLHSISVLSVAPEEFVVLSGIVSCIVNAILRFSIKFDSPKNENPSTSASRCNTLFTFVLIPALSALAGGASSVLQLTGAQTIDASLLYPFITGGSIVLTTVTGWFLFKEKISKNILIGVGCTLLGTLLFLKI